MQTGRLLSVREQQSCQTSAVALERVTVLKFTYIQLSWSQETEEVMDSCVSFFGAALGLGGQEAKEQHWIYLMMILDFQ